MASQLKIVMKCNEGEPLTAHNTIVYVDDEPVGCIQDIKVHVSVESPLPEIEVTFPNLRSASIDESYFKGPNLISSLDWSIERLSKFPNVKIKMIEIFGGIDETQHVEEVGTDGFIDSMRVDLE